MILEWISWKQIKGEVKQMLKEIEQQMEIMNHASPSATRVATEENFQISMHSYSISKTLAKEINLDFPKYFGGCEPST